MTHFEMVLPKPTPEVFSGEGDQASLLLSVGIINAVKIALRDSRLSEREIDVDVEIAGTDFLKIDPSLNSETKDLRYYTLIGKAPGSTIIDARLRNSNQRLASLSVVVQPSKAAAAFGDPMANFELGFIEGLGTVDTANVSNVANRIKVKPADFVAGYVDGVMRGLWAGLKDLFDGLVGLGAIAPYIAAATIPGIGAGLVAWKLSDPEFRKKAAEQIIWAKAVAEAAKTVVTELAKDPSGSVTKYLGASREAGRQVGEAFAAEIDKNAMLGGPIEYGQWIGWVVGRIAFEIIFTIATDGVGEAVKGASAGAQGMKGIRAVGEGAELFARVRSKIEAVLESLPALKKFVETLTKSKSAVTAAEVAAKAKAIAEAVEAAARARKAADSAAAIAKVAGVTEAADALARAKEAEAFAEVAKSANTSAQATEAAGKARASADAAETAAAKAKAAQPVYTPAERQLPPHTEPPNTPDFARNTNSHGERVVEREVLNNFLTKDLQMSAKSAGFDSFRDVRTMGVTTYAERGGVTVIEQKITGGVWTSIKSVAEARRDLVVAATNKAMELAANGLRGIRANSFERTATGFAYRTAYGGAPDRIVIFIRIQRGSVTPELVRAAEQAARESAYAGDLPPVSISMVSN